MTMRLRRSKRAGPVSKPRMNEKAASLRIFEAVLERARLTGRL